MLLLVRTLIRLYQLTVSPILSWLGGGITGCRFEPTCSHYFLGAVEAHGVLKGSWLGLKRLGRCHPWGGEGFDPVPPRRQSQITRSDFVQTVPASGRCCASNLGVRE
jgi:putative membrane protein insertion efficiency factor